MDEMIEITLDLTGCDYLGEIHQRIKKAFSFPDYYGQTWDALLDAFRTVGIPDKIIIKGTASLPADLIPQIERLIETLQYIKVELSGFGESFEYCMID